MLIVKVPAINGLGKTNGCENAPEKIISELNEIYTNEQGIEIKINKNQIKEISANQEDVEETNKNIYKEAKKIFTLNDFPIFIGGDHSITYPLLKSFIETFGNVGIIIFDAHADCVNRINEPTHEDWLRNVIEDGFPPQSIILIGLRNQFRNKNEKELKKINIFTTREIYDNIRMACDAVMEIARKFDALYLSIDIDAVDPAFAPATGYLEPAGLSSREIIYMIQRIKMLKNLKAVDIVEVNPKKDINNITSRLAAKIISELF